jgi:hypothetical protein
MRFFSYLYHGLLALLLILISGLALFNDPGTLRLGMLPWTGAALTYWVFFGSLAGLITVILAIRGTLPALFFIWSLLVAAMLLKVYVFSAYHFDRGEVATAGYLIAGSFIALAGAWFAMKMKRPKRV